MTPFTRHKYRAKRTVVDGVPSKPRRNETREVVKPILVWLACNGFIVLEHKQKRRGVKAKDQPLDGFRNAAWMLRMTSGKRRGVVWRANTGAAQLPGKGGRVHPIRFGEPGMADIVGVIPGGRWLCIECKNPGEKIAKNSQQEAFREVMGIFGGVHILATCIEDVATGLKAAGVIS